MPQRNRSTRTRFKLPTGRTVILSGADVSPAAAEISNWLTPTSDKNLERLRNIQVVKTDNDGSIKSFNWWIGANYHFGAR